MFLSPIGGYLWHCDNWNGGHFEKWPLPPPQVVSGWGPTLKLVIAGYTSCVPNFILVSQSARFFCQASGLIVVPNSLRVRTTLSKYLVLTHCWATVYDDGPSSINLFTTIHDGNFRRHSSMNVTIKLHKFSSNIYYIYVFFVIWSWKLR